MGGMYMILSKNKPKTNHQMKINIRETELIFSKESNIEIPSFDYFMRTIQLPQPWEYETFRTVDNCSDTNNLSLDIGAWIGPITLFMSKKFRKVISVESDKVACNALRQNISDNNLNNVDVIEKCIYNNSATELYFGLNPHHSEGPGDSCSQSRLNSSYDSDYRVEVITLDQIVEIYKDEKIVFVKIDIEGGEENILEDLFRIGSEKGWKVFISFHLAWWVNTNINRFSHLIPSIKRVFVSGGTDGINQDAREINPSEFLNHVSNFPFGSFYLEL
jgi:FkbM family methyltransferase